MKRSKFLSTLFLAPVLPVLAMTIPIRKEDEIISDETLKKNGWIKHDHSGAWPSDWKKDDILLRYRVRLHWDNKRYVLDISLELDKNKTYGDIRMLNNNGKFPMSIVDILVKTLISV